MAHQPQCFDGDAAAAEAESARVSRLQQVEHAAANSSFPRGPAIKADADDTANSGDRLLLDNLDGGLLFGEGGILHASSERLLSEIDLEIDVGEQDEDTDLPGGADLAPVTWTPLGASMDLDDGSLWQ